MIDYYYYTVSETINEEHSIHMEMDGANANNNVLDTFSSCSLSIAETVVGEPATVADANNSAQPLLLPGSETASKMTIKPRSKGHKQTEAADIMKKFVNAPSSVAPTTENFSAMRTNMSDHRVSIALTVHSGAMQPYSNGSEVLRLVCDLDTSGASGKEPRKSQMVAEDGVDIKSSQVIIDSANYFTFPSTIPATVCHSQRILCLKNAPSRRRSHLVLLPDKRKNTDGVEKKILPGAKCDQSTSTTSLQQPNAIPSNAPGNRDTRKVILTNSKSVSITKNQPISQWYKQTKAAKILKMLVNVPYLATATTSSLFHLGTNETESYLSVHITPSTNSDALPKYSDESAASIIRDIHISISENEQRRLSSFSEMPTPCTMSYSEDVQIVPTTNKQSADVELPQIEGEEACLDMRVVESDLSMPTITNTNSVSDIFKSSDCSSAVWNASPQPIRRRAETCSNKRDAASSLSIPTIIFKSSVSDIFKSCGTNSAEDEPHQKVLNSRNRLMTSESEIFCLSDASRTEGRDAGRHLVDPENGLSPGCCVPADAMQKKTSVSDIFTGCASNSAEMFSVYSSPISDVSANRQSLGSDEPIESPPSNPISTCDSVCYPYNDLNKKQPGYVRSDDDERISPPPRPLPKPTMKRPKISRPTSRGYVEKHLPHPLFSFISPATNNFIDSRRFKLANAHIPQEQFTSHRQRPNVEVDAGNPNNGYPTITLNLKRPTRCIGLSKKQRSKKK